MSAIYPFPAAYRESAGTIHVWGDRLEGFTTSHESASGDSWGELVGPFKLGQDAIAAAYALNRDQYGGSCNVFVCDAAIEDHCPNVGTVSLPGVCS